VGHGPENSFTPKNIARREVMGDIRAFCRAAAYSLKWGGTFSVVYRASRTADLLCAMREAGIPYLYQSAYDLTYNCLIKLLEV
jgi:tRNA1(Val) A37 N6-methylase TrmN6